MTDRGLKGKDEKKNYILIKDYDLHWWIILI